MMLHNTADTTEPYGAWVTATVTFTVDLALDLALALMVTVSISYACDGMRCDVIICNAMTE